MQTRQNKKSIWLGIDWITILLYFLLLIIGVLAIGGATYNFDIDALFLWGSRPMMQVLWIILAFIISGAILLTNFYIFEMFIPFFYIFMLGLLGLTIFIAPDIKGSHSWLVLGPIRLQPAEFAKIATALIISWKCNQHGFKIASIRSYATLIAFIIIPVLLIFAQNETGSALVYFALFLALFREGFSGLFLGLGFSATLYFIFSLIFANQYCVDNTSSLSLLIVYNLISFFSLSLYIIYSKDEERINHFLMAISIISLIHIVAYYISFYFYPFDISAISLSILILIILLLIIKSLKQYIWKYFFIALFSLGSLGFLYSVNYVFDNILEPHQQVRIKLVLGIEEDRRGTGYNVEQAKMAIGSGGWTGKGYLKGTQTNLKYVPEQDTDFIICTIGEEFGFVGTTALLTIYTLFILRLIILAERQKKRLARVYGYCVASIFFFHVFINVGMVIGILPVIGIPLPFLSYGGSSLWGFSIMLMLLLSMDAQRENPINLNKN